MASKPGRPDVMLALGSNEFLAELMRADGIFGVDEPSGNRFLLFGKSKLQSIVTSGQSMECRMATRTILQDSLELEALCAAVQVAKGHHEYEGSLASN